MTARRHTDPGRGGRLAALALTLALTSSACVDPLYEDQIDELGDEQSGFGPGPHHRPGQPCLRCHSQYNGHELVFSVAGTVFAEVQAGVDLQLVQGITVRLLDSEGNIATAVTNQCGNFYLTPLDFDPAYPIRAELWGNDGGELTLLRPMSSRIGRDGACGGCHIHPASPYSPGVVFVPLAIMPNSARIAGPGECPEPRFAEAP